MSLEKFVAGTLVFVRKRNGDERWAFKKQDKYPEIKHAAYVSIKLYEALSADYKDYLKRTGESWNLEQMNDFISEARQEDFKMPGGYIVFFFNDKGNYVLKHTPPVEKIEQVKQK